MSTHVLSFRQIRQKPRTAVSVLSYLSPENILFCNLLHNPAQSELWLLMNGMRKRLRPPQGGIFGGNRRCAPPPADWRLFFSCLLRMSAPAGGQTGPDDVGFPSLPNLTIFLFRMPHSFSLFMIDLRPGLRYNISIKLSNSSTQPPNF